MPSQKINFVRPRNTTKTASTFGGCLSGFLIPPLTALLIGGLLAIFALNNVTPYAADAATPAISPVFTPEVQWWRADIVRWANAAGLDPNLVATVMQIESCGDPRARSHAGATGLFQVMPFHFEAGEDPYRPETNALRGLNYLQRSLQAASGDVRLALAGYNGGISVIARGEHTWYAETVRYARWGIGIYLEASSGANDSPTLKEWLAAGGASLCGQARQNLGIIR
jgi:soluble lytic murein transglycosylase-like protein